jgi:hypothetical protein
VIEEQASFEPQAVLTRRRAGWNRLLIVVPVLAFALTAWAGISGPRSDGDQAANNRATEPPAASTSLVAIASQPQDRLAGRGFPSRVLGLDVRPLDDIPPQGDRGDAAIALAGWYVATAMTACPPDSDIVRPGLIADLGVDADPRTFCARVGVLYATPPDARNGSAPNDAEDGAGPAAALASVQATLTPGVVVPPELESVGMDATPVVFVGRLVDGSTVCYEPWGCPAALLVDRVVWAAGLGRAQTTSILPRLLQAGPDLSGRPHDDAADYAYGRSSGAVLMETLVDQPTLARVDPHAAALVAATSPHAERVWYRRTLGADAVRQNQQWIVTDDATGRPIASGWLGIPSGPRLPADGTNALDEGAPAR